MQKKLSIIIRTKNEENWLKACLKSISNQTFTNYEIILVDNNSSDKTVEIAKTNGVIKVASVSDFTPGHALQKGIEIANGDILVFLSAHCIPCSINWLKLLIQPLLNETSVASYGRQIPTRSSTPDDARDLLMVFGKESFTQKKDFKFHNANSAILRDYYQTCPFNESISNIEDWEWGRKTIANNKKISYVSEAAVYHHHGINQHESHQSFRSKAVSKILKDLYNLENLNPFFEDFKFWKGLLVISNSKKNNIKADQISEKFINDFDILITSHISENNAFKVPKNISFDDYLLLSLNYAEKVNNCIYDYLIFLDLHFQNIALDNVFYSRDILFKQMSDAAIPSRELNSFVYNQNFDFNTKVNNNTRIDGKINELIIGQGGAIRSSIIRRKILSSCKIIISNKLSRQYSFKENWNEN